MRIVHITSVHPRYDTRIYLKECQSLAAHGYEVFLIVADGKGDETRYGVDILDVGAPRGRIERIIRTPRKIEKKVRALGKCIVHAHDPELMPLALRLKKQGFQVLFDAHEDFPVQIQSKHYLPRFAKYMLSKVASFYETYVCKKLSGVVAATPHIYKKFVKMNLTTINVNNYPRISEFHPRSTEDGANSFDVCYVGSISRLRGLRECVDAIELVGGQARLKLAGNCPDKKFSTELTSRPGWQKVQQLGFLSREEVAAVYRGSIAGLVCLHPTSSYKESLPVKMFEYMCAGLPVIASNFPLWKGIITTADCGLCVNPLQPNEIASAIEFFISNPARAREMGENGRRAVEANYNWTNENEKLQKLYSEFRLSDTS